ncbi:hypothetical protein [Geodermatophilus sp. SYSU D01176]
MSNTAIYDWHARDGGPTAAKIEEAYAAAAVQEACCEHRRFYGVGS